MKIVQINTVCATGSTGRIAADLYNLIEENGHQAFFAYGRGSAPESIPNSYKIGDAWDFGWHVLRNFFRGESGFGSKKRTEKFLRWLDGVQPDIIHLHNIHGFYINVESLFRYIKERGIPTVWTLHDCWPFTGHCAHFDYAGCLKWKSECHSCKEHRRSYPYALFCDNSRRNFQKKKASFSGVDRLTIATPSSWLAELVGQSFLKGYLIKVVPNGIDLSLFCDTPDTEFARQIRFANGLEGKKVVLGVANIWGKRKGLSYILRLAEELDDRYRIILAGVSKRQSRILKRKYSGKIIPIMHTNSIQELASLYSITDVFVNASLEENFPTTNLEALACGTPVVTFRTGGSPEAIVEGCGKVVEKGNIAALKDAVEEVAAVSGMLKAPCRKQAEQYEKRMRYAPYMKIYEELSDN